MRSKTRGSACLYVFVNAYGTFAFCLLSDDEIDKVVTLRMNRDFMEYMRTYYPEVIKSVQPKYGTVINADDVRQQREKTPSQSLICSEASKLFQDRLL